MARGPKHHQKRLAAPNHWMLDKLSGKWAPKPSSGPHKARECLPLVVLLRQRLKYALTRKECIYILKNRLVEVDGKVRTDSTYPAGFMDVITIPKTNEIFRLLYDVKGRFYILRIKPEEATFKLCKIKKNFVGKGGVPTLVTHDGRTLRYPDPDIKVNDTIKLQLKDSKVLDHIVFEVGNLCMITGGKNIGRIGTIEKRDRSAGAIEIVHIKDVMGHTFATRAGNVFVIGKGHSSLVTVPKNKGVKLSIIEERERNLAKRK